MQRLFSVRKTRTSFRDFETKHVTNQNGSDKVQCDLRAFSLRLRHRVEQMHLVMRLRLQHWHFICMTLPTATVTAVHGESAALKEATHESCHAELATRAAEAYAYVIVESLGKGSVGHANAA